MDKKFAHKSTNSYANNATYSYFCYFSFAAQKDKKDNRHSLLKLLQSSINNLVRNKGVLILDQITVGKASKMAAKGLKRTKKDNKH